MKTKPKGKAGRPPLFGVPVKNYLVALTPEMAAFLKDLGKGNRSEGVRMLVRWHRGETDTPT